MNEPYILAERREYLVVYKPRGMHSAPLSPGERDTLLTWCAERFPDVLAPRGRKAVEGGLLHRLDGDTEGLVLIARDQKTYDFLCSEQDSGAFSKDYEAICVPRTGTSRILGFPPAPPVQRPPFFVASAFRPFGPGRRAVRPVLMNAVEPNSAGKRRRDVAFDRGQPYRTELLRSESLANGQTRVIVRLARGFRHQIRCHLAWLGSPIRGDSLYGAEIGDVPLALTAMALSFLDPGTGLPTRYELPKSSVFESVS